MTLIYGTNKLRNMSIASSRLFKMLIDASCFSLISWTGRGVKGKNQLHAFKNHTNIQKVLLEALNMMDNSYNQKDLHEDIVYKILKFGNSTKK